MRLVGCRLNSDINDLGEQIPESLVEGCKLEVKGGCPHQDEDHPYRTMCKVPDGPECGFREELSAWEKEDMQKHQ